MNFVRTNSNPNAAMQNFVKSNPQMKQALDYINQNGGNAEQAFYSLAKEKGVNPDYILSFLK
jgi:hypothetical protein